MAERKTRESNWTHGWPSIIAVGMIVVAAGFAVGVIAGITWEEPGLVVGYLGGQTEAIEWSGEAESGEAEDGGAADLVADGAIPEPPSVAAPPPLGMHRESDNPVPDRAKTGSGAGASTEREAARAAEPTSDRPAKGFAVQVGAFSEKRSAQALADSLRANGYAVYLSPSEGNPVSWRVRVGPLRTRPEAERAARKLETAQKLPTWVLGEGS